MNVKPVILKVKPVILKVKPVILKVKPVIFKVKPAILFILLLFSLLDSRAQTTFTVMEYNCENVFDTIHDEGKDDYEFLAGGERNWRRWKLAEKLRGIAKVIAAADERRPVDLVALCEVENDSVMTWLTKRTILAGMGYEYVMTDNDDPRGIDVALMYSPFTFHPFENQSIKPPVPSRHTTRDILRVSGTVVNGDTLDVYVLHLPSKLGGREAELLSISIVHKLASDIDSLMQCRTRPNVVVMGDFNAEPRTRWMKRFVRGCRLVDLTAKVKPGTYKYQGAWSTIDHILCHASSLRHLQSQVLMLPQLVEDDPVNGGVKPWRTFLGPAYKGGISDHLPLVSRFVLTSH